MAGRPAVTTLIVGDVHGCSEELRQLVRIVAPDEVVLVGDLYTKGPDPVGVWRQISDGHMRAIRGNHDERLLKALDGKRRNDEHAAEVIAALDADDPRWRAHLRSLPLYLEVGGWTVVHASIHPSGDLSRTKPRDFQVRRRWPDDAPGNDHWWRHYRGDRRVVFGHDAVQGLVQHRRGDRLWVVGLDSGCVYGGSLTGLMLPDEGLVQVPALRAYQPVGRLRSRR